MKDTKNELDPKINQKGYMVHLTKYVRDYEDEHNIVFFFDPDRVNGFGVEVSKTAGLNCTKKTIDKTM